ncbi:CAP domain-containing protein [Nitrososphaera sp.]|uniref:CAP domain-containing protein n=1 Tax=Nitrososphaera sp. TaxID=1971748 RepID=UPI0017C25752|nr:CAP domain-containing protein [Nitrososphaera sp.]NWG37832.1 CAP domain-containing protein [Nitrososphaera sp.]
MVGPFAWAAIAAVVAILGVYAVYLYQNPYVLNPPTTDQIALAIHERVNEEREKAGRPVLVWDPTLATVAQGWSDEMATRNIFQHHDPNTQWAHEHRYAKAGYYCEASAENLFWHGETGPISSERLAKEVVQGWMESTEGHKENILFPFAREGIGVAFNDERGYYVTQNFC